MADTLKHSRSRRKRVDRPRLVVPWPDREDYDGETAQLVRTVEDGWDWAFPGWQWIADSINAEYGNNRTAAACRAKYERELSRHNGKDQP